MLSALPEGCPIDRAVRGNHSTTTQTFSALHALILLSIAHRSCTVGASFAFPDFTDADGILSQGVANRTGTSLRLTPAAPNLAGAVWHGVKQTVIGGFSTEFSFRVVPRDEDKSPGPCKWVDHSEGKCARRGGDGFAFVVQNYSPKALGSGGGGLGYSGISNAVVVEFDTWFDSELKDPFENHLAVLTRGVGELRAEHNNHLGVCLDVPDLADGQGHNVHLRYDPLFQTEIALHPSFQAAPHLIDLIYPSAVHFRHGLGTLRIYIDDSTSPTLSVPMSLSAFLKLDRGAAWVGFTASTGDSYQSHEITSWSFLEHTSEHDMINTNGDVQVPILI